MRRTRFQEYLLLATYTVLLVFVLFSLDRVSGKIAWLLSVVTPFVYGFAIAFVLNHPLMFLQKRVFEPLWRMAGFRSKKGVKAVSLMVTYLLLLLFIAALFSIVIPQLINSIATLVNSMPTHLSAFDDMVNSFLEAYPMDTTILTWLSEYWTELLNTFANVMSNLLPLLVDAAQRITERVSNFTIGFVVSIYLLLAKERFIAQGKKLVYAFVPLRYADKVMEVARLTNRTFGGFISGQLTVSLIVGVLCFVGMTIFQMPYALLSSVIVGVTNVIPFFGPFLGAIPCIFIIMVSSPVKALGFGVMIVVIQQFDGNFLSPKIVGNSVGLSGVWVLFAILVGGGLWGIVGMVIGLPTFAVLYNLLRQLTYHRLGRRGIDPKNPEELPEKAEPQGPADCQ